MGLAEPLSAALAAAEARSGGGGLLGLLEPILSRVEELEPRIEALLPEPGRRERILAEARALEARYPDPAARPPLYGLLLGVKDIFRAEGFETRCGSRLPPALFAGSEAPSVSALRRAGALVLGKTVTTEFAYFSPGPTRNPRDPSRTPGGSSSGSAAAVAAGFAHLALGTQTIGSIGRPAAYCGVAGWKPSHGRVPREGVVPFAPSLDHVGLLAADAASAALGAASLDPGWREAPFRAAAARRALPILAVPEGPYLDQAEPAALAAFEEALLRLEEAGFGIRRVYAMPDIERVNESHRRLAAAEMALSHRAWFPGREGLYAPATRELIERGIAVPGAELEAARAGRLALRRELEAGLARELAELWVSPAAPGPAPEGLASTGSPIMNLPWTNAGLPTLVLPALPGPEGLPLGLQLAAPFGADEALLGLGLLVEAALR